MKLRTKIHLITTLLMLILLALMNSGVYVLYEQLAINTEYKQLKVRGEELLTSFNQLTDVAVTDPYIVLRAYMPTDGAIRLLDASGKQLSSVDASLEIENIKLELGKDENYAKREIEGTPVIMIETPAIWIDGSVVKLQLLQRLTEVANNAELLKLILIAVTTIIAIPLLLSNMALSRIILKPLDRLNLAMKKSRTTGTYEKIEKAEAGKDELAEIGRTFNGMMEALETNYKKQEQFVSNASHELKTPLTVIESYAKLLLRRGFTNEKVAQEALEAIAYESDRMNDLIVQMLELAKNKENASLSINQVDVSLLLESTVSQMHQAYNRTFEIQGDSHLSVQTDGKKLKQLLFIILDNARKYSEDKIIITTRKQEKSISIAIQDFGEGIAQEQIPHLFDRFYRVSKDRNRKTGGSGLGLAIAKELSKKLQIVINVQSELGGGACFTLLIPFKIEAKQEEQK
ncbi:sensor histidine kinase [Ureibacillus chungkukjangi]|uniref:histidine kinase n=1 Tax=Ureibacillus chungkukjangi TaxID=1202712 RepID=A0A318TJV7_9BACL|nr:HAMP domain-containing sensor histidine kinase [Ureibacillus chungkukjangi]MCM3389414.1 HAMP domain-containing histidine kinase [Ureibacillus chungkukjangi]PYF05181.1 signal transduction histidine kinase [Ureibacillus chungkukjangi]